ncbi:MAG TPA: radical SAM protein [Candidatus Hydrogenedens sp.]|nr:radical SAM protein [Candidatus Hydrogenedens sp.]HOK08042.1 radical SAM protein [Candidatus Hydrogenedens sp.]HOL20802.1 radical SAM protein [Candidatus Hydrogenedens sp.]HPP57965.1 radical SAM protein [Candidatus Hydrogenedens sp.]
MAYEKESSRLIHWQVSKQLELTEIVFFLTNRCNQRCLTCWQWEEDFKSVGKELSDEKWIELLYDAIGLGAQHLYIVGGGEPMVRGALVLKLAEIAKQHGMFCVLHTNGTLLKREQMDRFIELGWDQIIVSIDGPSEAINDAIRGEGTFKKAVDSLSYINEHRCFKPHPTPDLGVNVTITNKNYMYIEEMVSLASKNGCGGIHATLVQPFNKNAEQFVLSDTEQNECIMYLEKAKNMAENLGMYHTFDSVLKSLNIHNDEVEKEYVKENGIREEKGEFIDTYCFEPFLSMTVSADGKVSPCCMFWNEQNPSVLEYSLKEVWEGEFFKLLRTQLQKNKDSLPDICVRCPSQLRKRTEGIRNELIQKYINTTKNPILLAQRFVKRLRNEGLQSAFQRLKEWLFLQKKKIQL